MENTQSLPIASKGNKFNSPNDVVLGPDGALYFTDPTLDLPKGEKQELAYQGVFRLDASGKVTLLTKELSQPNGLAFSADGKKFYVDDSQQRNIRVYDFRSDGTIANGRIFGEEPGGKGDGVPDGIKVDRDGKCLCHGSPGNLDMGRRRTSPGHNRHARTAGESCLGRC